MCDALAATQVYADLVLDELDPEGKIFKERLYRQDCTLLSGGYSKDLTKLSEDLSRVVLVSHGGLGWAVYAMCAPIHAIALYIYIDGPGDEWPGKCARRSAARSVCVCVPLAGSNFQNMATNKMTQVDNNPLCLQLQPQNGILIDSFYDSEQDRCLPWLFRLLNHLDTAEDVRSALNRDTSWGHPKDARLFELQNKAANQK